MKIVADDTKLEFFENTRDVWDAMYDDCRRATESIEFEQYILRDDAAGHRFLALFTEKARQGIAIRLLLDRIGSRSLYDSPLIGDIRRHGGEVHFYNTIGWRHIFRPSSWFPRNHTKTMLIDRRIAYIGSACLAAHMRNWRDMQVRMTGGLVQDIRRDFSHMWCRTPGGACDGLPGPGEQPEPDRLPPNRPQLSLPEAQALLDRTRRRLIRYAVTRPRLTDNPIYASLLTQIYEARHSIRIVTPYFMPPWRLRRALRDAARRGVAVTLMMGEKTDTPLADRVAQSYFSHFLADGIRIFLYRRTVLHAKYVVIDGSWATLGSTNIDYLSLVKNREANIIIRHRPTVLALARLFEADRAACAPVDETYWRTRPLRFRIGGYCGRVLRRFL